MLQKTVHTLKVEPPSKVTPLLQTEMRKGKRKTLKKGRKRGVLKKAKGSGDEKVTKKSKGKAATGQTRTRKAKDEKVEGSVPNDVAKPKRKRTRTPKTEASDAPAPKAKGKRTKVESEECNKQERVGTGKNWRYKVLEGQRYGCTNCRYIYNGCKACQKATFRGRSAQQVWDEEDSKAQKEIAEAVAPAAEKGKRKRVRKAKAEKTNEA